MTKLLKKAIAEARRLPPEEQDAIGAMILEEIADEKRWAKKFAETKDQLARWADEALAEIEAGRTMPLDFNRRAVAAKTAAGPAADPFATFGEWSSPEDEKAYRDL